jgi:hypothetical protein
MKLFEWWYRRNKKDKPVKYSGLIYLDTFDNLPATLKNSVYIIGTTMKPKWVVFNCPDKCGHRVEVNLMKSKVPFWIAKITRNKVSLQPSIVVNSCHSHFYLVDNRVEWS